MHKIVFASDQRLGRNINHDPRSRMFALDTSNLDIQSVKHQRRITVLEQGNLGSCVGNAGIGCLGTEPYVSDLLTEGYQLNETGAVQLYSDATKIDPFEGEYPPTDTGSDGLSVAKVLKAKGEISGYQWVFSLNDALKALALGPFITGVYWMNDMFHPDSDGRVRPTGGVAGGHEFVADELDVERGRIWFTNSWGVDWGVQGRFYMTFVDYGSLLAQQGDVTIFVPVSEPAPIPNADAALALIAKPWVAKRHAGGNNVMSNALKLWLKTKGL